MKINNYNNQALASQKIGVKCQTKYLTISLNHNHMVAIINFMLQYRLCLKHQRKRLLWRELKIKMRIPKCSDRLLLISEFQIILINQIEEINTKKIKHKRKKDSLKLKKEPQATAVSIPYYYMTKRGTLRIGKLSPGNTSLVIYDNHDWERQMP